MRKCAALFSCLLAASASSQIVNVTSSVSVPQTVTGTTYYVSNSGSNSNPGTSPSTPWQTLAKVNSSTFGPCDQILLDSSSVWHEQLTLPSGGSATCQFTVGAYGPTLTKPIIDGSTVVTGWTLQSGSTYQAPYTPTAWKAFVDSLYVESVPLAVQTSLANVNATPGSVYSDGTNVYVHLLDGSSPLAHTIEVTGDRYYGVTLGPNNYVTVQGLEVIRTLHAGILSFQNATNTGPNRPQAEYNQFFNNFFFNNGVPGENILDPSLQEGAIVVTGGPSLIGQFPLRGIVVAGNTVGMMDVHRKIDYRQAGLQITNTTGAVVSGNTVRTTNAMGIQLRGVQDNQVFDSGMVYENSLSSNLGNISAEGANSLVDSNIITDGYGFGIQVGSNSTIRYNLIRNLAITPDGTLYNGIDTNHVTNGFVIGNTIQNVSKCVMDLENVATGWTVTSNIFDANGVNNTGGCVINITGGSIPGTTLINNTYIENPGVTNGFHYGGTDLLAGNPVTRATFMSTANVNQPVYATTINAASTITSFATSGFGLKFNAGCVNDYDWISWASTVRIGTTSSCAVRYEATGGHLFYAGGSNTFNVYPTFAQVTNNLVVSGYSSAATFRTATNCSSAASPAVCGSAASGTAVIAAAASSVVVNTTAITANSIVQLTFDASLSTKLGVTCNTTLATLLVTARVSGTSFTVGTTASPTTNPACFSYTIVN